jgi:hypothetical protein
MVASITWVNLLLISSWIMFWFVIVVPKYVNCATFSKHLLPIVIHSYSKLAMIRNSKIQPILSQLKRSVLRIPYADFVISAPMWEKPCLPSCLRQYWTHLDTDIRDRESIPMKISVFRDVTSCSLVDMYQHFRGTNLPNCIRSHVWRLQVYKFNFGLCRP